MATVKEMRTRIGSVKSTQKITKALQMVAAAKLRRSQQAAEAARPYAQRMAAIISNLAASVSGPSAPLLLAGTGKDDRHLIIVATSDRGLAGAFNSSIVREARRELARLTAEAKTAKVITIGRKARDQLRRQYGSQFIESYEVGLKSPGLALVQPIAKKILDLYNAGEFDVVTLVGARAHQQLRRAFARHAGGEVGDDGGHPLGIGPGVLGGVLAAAQFRRRHHLQRLRDLLRGLHASDPTAHFLEAGHSLGPDPRAQAQAKVSAKAASTDFRSSSTFLRSFSVLALSCRK